MILRLVIAYTRWVWDGSPAFVTADSDMWYTIMAAGMLIDIGAIAVPIVILVDILSSRLK